MDRTPPGSPIFRILGLLEGVRKQGSGWEARCPGPSHRNADRHPSLSIGTGTDGRALLHCQAGCTTDDVLAALGLDFSALFEKDRQGDRVRRFNLYSNGHVVATHVRVDKPDGKRIHWERNGHSGLDDLKVTELPLYGAEQLAGRPGEPVYLCEGEKAAQALIDLGLLAVATVTGAATIPSDAALAALQGRWVHLWPDNDQDGLGHMLAIAERLVASTVVWIKWPEAPEHGDAADYVAMGGTADDLAYLVEAAAQAEPQAPPQAAGTATIDAIVQANGLMRMTFSDPRWAVPGVLPEGVALIAGKTKLGKSWLALDIGIAVADGGLLWGSIRCAQGDVLYLALEDSLRRIQGRLRLLGQPGPPRLGFITDWDRADEGGIDRIVVWLRDNPEARLIIIDVLEKFRPRVKGKVDADLYRRDYETIAPIAEMARGRGVCILVIHHCNKRIDPQDPLDSISGTTGLVGAADVVGVFRRERLKDRAEYASLLITGRDVEEQELALEFVLRDQCGLAWRHVGEAAQVRMSAERLAILGEVSRDPGQKPQTYAERLGKNSGAVRKTIWMMVRDGQLRLIEGGYYPPVDGVSQSNGNSVTPGTGPGVTGVTTVTGGITDTSVSVVTADLFASDSGNASNRSCRWCGRSMPHPPDDRCKIPEDQP